MASGTNGENRSSAEPHIIVRNLTMTYGSFVLMRELNFVVKRGDIFIIMGGRRMRQKHAAASSDRAQGTRHGRDHIRGHQLHAG